MAQSEEEQPYSPSILARWWRAFLYFLVVVITLLAGYHYSPKPIFDNLLTLSKLLSIWLVLSWCLLTSIVYVNVYILTPIFEKDARANKYRTRLATITIVAHIICLAVIPTAVVGLYGVIYAGIISPKLYYFISACLIIPSIMYMATLFNKSGHFFNRQDKIQEGLFFFRHQLISPAMILVTVPFCCGYAIAEGISIVQLVFMLAIQVAYALICYTKENTKKTISFMRKTAKINLFLTLCLVLLILANVVAYKKGPDLAFIVFGVALGLFMTAYEFFGTIYFKEIENNIRLTYTHLQQIDLSAKYSTYYQSAATAFTALAVFFPMTYLYSVWLSFTYLIPTIAVLFAVWIGWVDRAQTFWEDPTKIGCLRKIKGLAIVAPLTILANSIIPWREAVGGDGALSLMGPLCGLATFLIGITFVNSPEYKAKFRSSVFYWFGGFLMILLCSLLIWAKWSNEEQRLALAWVYFSAGVLTTIIFSWNESEVIKARSMFSRNGK